MSWNVSWCFIIVSSDLLFWSIKSSSKDPRVTTDCKKPLGFNWRLCFTSERDLLNMLPSGSWRGVFWVWIQPSAGGLRAHGAGLPGSVPSLAVRLTLSWASLLSRTSIPQTLPSSSPSEPRQRSMSPDHSQHRFINAQRECNRKLKWFRKEWYL